MIKSSFYNAENGGTLQFTARMSQASVQTWPEFSTASLSEQLTVKYLSERPVA